METIRHVSHALIEHMAVFLVYNSDGAVESTGLAILGVDPVTSFSF